MLTILTNITECRGALSRRTLAKCAAAAAALGADVVSGSASAADTQVTVMTGNPRRHGSSFVLSPTNFCTRRHSVGLRLLRRFTPDCMRARFVLSCRRDSAVSVRRW